MALVASPCNPAYYRDGLTVRGTNYGDQEGDSEHPRRLQPQMSAVARSELAAVVGRRLAEKGTRSTKEPRH